MNGAEPLVALAGFGLSPAVLVGEPMASFPEDEEFEDFDEDAP